MALRLGLLRIWLLSLIIALVAGCGGHDDGDIDFGDAAIDIRRDTTSDRANDASNSDVRTDGTVDASTDTRVDVAADNRVDVPVVDNRVDPAIDTRVDPPIDVRVDPAVDARVDTPVVDTRVDVPSDRGPDAVVDVRVDPRVDVAADVTPGCSSDSQCTDVLNPHCNVVTGQCVKRVSLSVTPASPSIAAGTTKQFAATMTYSDTSTGDVTAQATWTSSNTGFATMSNTTPGLATGVAEGSSTISASFGGQAGGTLLTVTMKTLGSIQVTPPSATAAAGTTTQFTATGVYSDNTTQDITSSATWTSSATNFATINSTGLATAVAVGPTTIMATVGMVNNSVTFTVTQATLKTIEISPASPTIATTTTQDFTATAVLTDNTRQPLLGATWASSDTLVASILTTSTGATATGLSAGPSTISATFNGVVGSTVLTVNGATLTSIDVTPAASTLPVGFNSQFHAVGHFSGSPDLDITTSVLWESSTPPFATISNAGGSKGLATGATVGLTNITAKLAGITGTTTLNVVAATLDSVTVTPSSASVPIGLTQTFTATATFNGGGFTLDITDQASWSSTLPGVATVLAPGVATGVSKGGPTTIIASYKGGAGTAQLTVLDNSDLVGIVITPVGASIPVGQTLQFTATGSYSDNSQHNISELVTWGQDDFNVIDVSQVAGTRGLALAKATGPANITANLNSITATLAVTVP